ncbi:TetR/AcrR family transcriptional regulator [Blastococcus sp. SYSU DS0510]
MGEDVSGPESGLSIGLLGIAGDRPVAERADAARNRRRILAAAEGLFAERGVPGVTMDDIAAEAGVGKGTLYRRFTDKGGLAAALLDERGRQFQEAILGGPPPLGPGAPAVDRLVAFVAGYLEFQVRHLDLVLLSETSTPGSRLRKGSYGFWRQHCAVLLRASGAPDPLERAELLLAGLSAEQVHHWTRVEERPAAALGAALSRLARSIAGADR